jgi:hypothetical protein
MYATIILATGKKPILSDEFLITTPIRKSFSAILDIFLIFCRGGHVIIYEETQYDIDIRWNTILKIFQANVFFIR